MNNIKFVYFNIETINSRLLENELVHSSQYKSHVEIKPGFFLVNFHGSAHDLYDIVSTITSDNSILIYDLDRNENAYWGYMNKSIWEWIKANTDSYNL